MTVGKVVALRRRALPRRGYRMVRLMLNTRFPQGVMSLRSRYGAPAVAVEKEDSAREVLVVEAATPRPISRSLLTNSWISGSEVAGSEVPAREVMVAVGVRRLLRVVELVVTEVTPKQAAALVVVDMQPS